MEQALRAHQQLKTALDPSESLGKAILGWRCTKRQLLALFRSGANAELMEARLNRLRDGEGESVSAGSDTTPGKILTHLIRHGFGNNLLAKI